MRIDSHTAMEARGKYARLCIQVDLIKLLINTFIIVRFEQEVSYEGKSPLAAMEEDQVAQPLKPRAEHEGCRTFANDGMLNVCEEGDPEGQYGIVLRPDGARKSGPEIGYSTHPYKPSSLSIDTSLLSRHRPSSLTQSPSHEPMQPPSETFEFSATTKVKGGHSDFKCGVGKCKSETQSRKWLAQTQNGGDFEVPFTNHGAQSPFGSSSSEDGGCGVLLDIGYREGSVNENVDEDRMESEEGGRVSSSL
nr:hypothetical protein CFP56_29537 [Quercus suber]